MVRLRDKKRQLKTDPQFAFQFQNGAIESRQRTLQLLPGLYFNSKMVRLREIRPANVAEAIFLFQFQNGAIESYWIVSKSGALYNFNSKMVRLRAHKAGTT